jgi:hypothetical protein
MSGEAGIESTDKYVTAISSAARLIVSIYVMSIRFQYPHLWVETGGNPVKKRRGNTNDCEAVFIDEKRSSENRVVSVELRFPAIIADYYWGFGGWNSTLSQSEKPAFYGYDP